MKGTDTEIKIRLNSFRFTHSSIYEIFDKIVVKGIQIGQRPTKLMAYYPFDGYNYPVRSIDIEIDDKKDGHEKFREIITATCRDIETIVLDYLCQIPDRVLRIYGICDSEFNPVFEYRVSFTKTIDNPSGLISFYFPGIQMDGNYHGMIQFVGDEFLYDRIQKTFDELFLHSVFAYQVVKDWMDALEAEECWGVGDNGWTDPEMDGFHYTDCCFRFTRNGPQLLELSMERARTYTVKEADELLYQEFPELLTPINGSKPYYNKPLMRLVDLPWNAYYRAFKQGEMSRLQAVCKEKLYFSGADSIFPELQKRKLKYIELKRDIAEKKYNFDTGFMTV